MRKHVEIVKIKELLKIYKDSELASNIEAVRFEYLNGDECGFIVIAQKGLHIVGEKSVYIAPDYCLPGNSNLFLSFTEPDGNPNKSRLGKENRIRAIKFNFGLSPDNNGPIYSNGILLPYKEVEDFLNVDLESVDLVENLNITKYEEPMKMGGYSIGGFPSYLYKTDETNIMSVVSSIKKLIDGKRKFGITLKHDGSSTTVTFTKNDTYETSVYSRSNKQRLDSKVVTGYVNDVEELHKYFDKESGVLCWRGKLTGTIYSDEEALENFEKIEKDDPSAFVRLSEECGLLENGLEFCKNENIQLAFRGEIIGSGLKGSGNKNNPDSKLKPQLILFGIDLIEDGYAKRQNYSDKYNLETVSEKLGLTYTKQKVYVPSSFEDLIEFCNNIFNEEKSEGRLIEGVVIRTLDSNDISCKYMNDEYDSIK
jgi:hypothetical protein